MGQEDRETSQPEEHPKAQDQQSITVFTFCRTYWITYSGQKLLHHHHPLPHPHHVYIYFCHICVIYKVHICTHIESALSPSQPLAFPFISLASIVPTIVCFFSFFHFHGIYLFWLFFANYCSPVFSFLLIFFINLALGPRALALLN